MNKLVNVFSAAPRHIETWSYSVEEFIHEAETQMAVLQQHPASLGHEGLEETSGVDLLSLPHADGTATWWIDQFHNEFKLMDVSAANA